MPQPHRSPWPARALGRAVAVAIALTAGMAVADGGARIDAQVSSSIVGSEDRFQLVVTVEHDAQQLDESYVQPDLKDFDVLGTSQSMQVNMSSAGARSTTSYTYALRPKKKGKLVIGPATARVGGKSLQSRAVTVQVSAAAHVAQAANPNGASGGIGLRGGVFDPFGGSPFGGFGMSPPAPPTGMHGDEDIFIEARVEPQAGQSAPPEKIYVGEEVDVSWRLYTRTDVLRYRTVTDPKSDDFWSEELYTPPGRLAWQRQTVNGQDYQTAVLLKRALFPLRAGKLEVGPLQAETTTMESAFYAGASAVRSSRQLAIEVLPLPAAGRPAGFQSANVGRYAVRATVSDAHPKAGEAITWRIVVEGRGNLRHLKLPRYDKLDGFKVYDPTVAEDVERKDDGLSGTRSASYLLLPRKGGPLTLPAVELPYFDPAEQKYAVATAPALTITVDGDPTKLGAAEKDPGENLLAPRIRPLRIVHHLRNDLGERVLRGPLFWVALALPPALLLVIMLGGAVRTRLRRETVGSRRRRALAVARRHMRACEQHLSAERTSEFYGECARALYDQLEYRLGLRCESYTVEELRRLLGERGFPDEVARAVTGELEQCDYARFAASTTADATTGEELRVVLRRVRQLLVAIDRTHLRPAATQGRKQGASA